MTSKNKLTNLYKAILSLETEKEVENFFKDLMTPQEIVNFADRLEVAEQLYAGKTQREVARNTSVALATVTRVNRFLTNGFNGYTLILNRLHNHPHRRV